MPARNANSRVATRAGDDIAVGRLLSKSGARFQSHLAEHDSRRAEAFERSLEHGQSRERAQKKPPWRNGIIAGPCSRQRA